MSGPCLRWLPGRYGVYRFAPDTSLPAWTGEGAFTSVSRSRGELSVLCAWRDRWHDDGSALPHIGPLACAALDGPLDFSLTGIIARLTAPLAREGISVFSVATYDTDYLLVGEGDATRTQAALEADGVRFAAYG